MSVRPSRLIATPYEKVWGTGALAPWFADSDKRIGEVWFTAPEGKLPILVKLIFTSDRLSVQVHPDDAYAAAHEGGAAGKTEMWHVLRAQPGASIGLGFREPLTRQRLREAALSGEIERLVNWTSVRAGDTYFTPAGTVHAIGAGIALCEIQQNADITYRLYDYGRPRELHLEKALQVADLGSHPGRAVPQDLGNGWQLLASCPYFRTEKATLSSPLDYRPDPARFHLLIVIEGLGTLAGEAFTAGQVWLAPEGAPAFSIAPDGPVTLLCTYVP